VRSEQPHQNLSVRERAQTYASEGVSRSRHALSREKGKPGITVHTSGRLLDYQ